MAFLGAPLHGSGQGTQGEPGLVVGNLLILILTIPIRCPAGLVGSREAPAPPRSVFNCQLGSLAAAAGARPAAHGWSTLERSQEFTGGLAPSQRCQKVHNSKC